MHRLFHNSARWIGMALLATVVTLPGCAALQPAPKGFGVGYEETGRASWYGPGFHGKHAANGEVYDQDGLTAAHKELPFGSMVQVTRADTGQSVVVRITDRGPFVGGRILDMSREAARRLDAIGPGVVPVRIRVVSAPEAPASAGTGYTVQLGSFTDLSGARTQLDTLGHTIPGLRLIHVTKDGSVRLVTRPYASQEQAARVAWRIRRDLLPDAFVVTEPYLTYQ